MARPREPIALVQAKGKKHLTKEEIKEREAREVQPCTDDVTAPSYLTAAQKKQFDKLANQLKKIGIMGETDVDILARYVTAQGLYEKAVKDLRKLESDRPKDKTAEHYYEALELWYKMQDRATQRQERYFKQVNAAARELGLTISSRCKLVVPVKDEAPKENKFAKFGKVAGAE